MPLLIALFVVAVAAPIGVGVLAHRRGWHVAGGPTMWGQRAAARFGPVPAAVGLVLAGWVVSLVGGLGLGYLAKALESSVDRPVFDWVHVRVHNTAFTRLNEKLTFIGNNPIVQIVALIAGIILAFALGRRWWIAIAGLAVGYFGEHYLQKALARIVDRGHPPTTLGTWPSGGVARILAVYAVIVFLAIFLLPRLSRAWRAGLWTGLTTAAVVEAFTRVYLSRHWFTDAALALPFGALLALTVIAALAAATAGVRVQAIGETAAGATAGLAPVDAGARVPRRPQPNGSG